MPISLDVPLQRECRASLHASLPEMAGSLADQHSVGDASNRIRSSTNDRTAAQGQTRHQHKRRVLQYYQARLHSRAPASHPSDYASSARKGHRNAGPSASDKSQAMSWCRRPCVCRALSFGAGLYRPRYVHNRGSGGGRKKTASTNYRYADEGQHRPRDLTCPLLAQSGHP
jgi:hypothetical protein